MFKPLVLLLLLPLLSVHAFSQAAEPIEDTNDALDVLPGHWQFTHGDPVLGTLAAAGAVANLAPLFVSGGADAEYWTERDGLHYFAWSQPTAADRALNASVGVAGIWGGFFSIYGEWDQYVKTNQAGRFAKYGSLNMGDYLLAPFQPEFVFNFDVFPVFPLLELAPISLDDWRRAGAFFQRGSVDFLGYSVPPAAGLAMITAGAMSLVAANAALEEIAFRGIALDRMGLVGSSLYFGLNHLLNPFALPNFSFEEAAQQAGYATLFGFYAGSRTQANGGDFRRMIALHFWHNVTTIVLGYLIDPEHAQLFSITVPL